MKFVKDVTLLTILGNKSPSFKENFRVIDKILDISYPTLRFEKIKILTAFKEDYIFKDKEVIIENIPAMSQREYNAFCLNKLTDYVDTKYVLVFQNDGFIVNPQNWDDEFLKYDYVGAPWPGYPQPRNWDAIAKFINDKGFLKNKNLISPLANVENLTGETLKQLVDLKLVPIEDNRVGNGGFSLRTKKLIELTKDLKYIDNIGLSGGTCTPEDYLICKYYYDYLFSNNIRFAPLDVAIRFSYEQDISEFPNWNHDLSLGFHGLFQSGWESNSFRNYIKNKYYT